MNNRKQLNKRGKNPRQNFIQTIIEKPTITRSILGVTTEKPNPRFGLVTKIEHRNFPPIKQ